MDGNVLSLLLEAIVAALLVAVLAYGVRLNRNLTAVRSGREELEKLLKDFGLSTERAEKALADLRAGSEERVNDIAAITAKAQSIADDLDFLTKRGEALADRLEKTVRQETSTSTRSAITSDRPARKEASEDPPPEPQAKPAAEQHEQTKARSKSELLKALQGMR